MGRSIPFATETRHFASKGEATLFFRTMLNRYKPGDRVAIADTADIDALLKKHSDYRAKVGVGVDHFEVMSAEHNTQCFRVVRTDGTGEDFSYIHCITPKKG